MPTSVLILCQRKTGSTALMFAIGKGGNLKTKLEPRNLTPPQRNVVVKRVVENQKDGDRDAEAYLSFKKRIFLVRDPRDILISQLLYSTFQSRQLCGNADLATEYVKALLRKQRAPHAISFQSLLEWYKANAGIDALHRTVKNLNKVMELYQQHKGLFFLYRYEDYVRGKVRELEKYLGFSLGVAEMTGKFERVVRAKVANDWRNWFTVEDNIRYSKLFANYMTLFEYQRGAVSTDPKIRFDHAAGYVLRLIHNVNGKTSAEVERRTRGMPT